MLINIKSFKLSLLLILYIDLDIRLCFLWFIYNRLIIFYNELTHLAPKKKKKKKLILDGTCCTNLNSI